MQNFNERTNERTNGNNYVIDCFRILAVLMVLTVHVRVYLKDVPPAIDKLFSFGAYGVALYFIISGFLSYPSIGKSKNFTAYLRKKCARILPMYYVSLIGTFLLGGVILKEYPLNWRWIYHVFFLNMFVPAKEWMWWNSVNFFWTMPAFVAWYIVSYLLLKRVNRSVQMTMIALLVSIVTPTIKNTMSVFASQQFVNWNFFCLLYVFCFGALAYFVLKEKKYISGCIYGVLIGVLGLFFGNRSGFFLFGLLFYLMIIVFNTVPIRWLNEIINKKIKLLSAISYSTYLTHWFVLKLCGSWLEMQPWIIAYLTFIVIAGGFGYFCYRFIEKPSSNWIISKHTIPRK